MASFYFAVYFLHRVETFHIDLDFLYNDLLLAVEDSFGINRIIFIMQIYDDRFKMYVEFDDEYINWLRNRLPRTSEETIIGRIVLRRQRKWLTSQLSVSKIVSRPSRAGHQIIWLDKYIGLPENCRQMKKKFCSITRTDYRSIEKDRFPIDIDNLIRLDHSSSGRRSTTGHFSTFDQMDACLEFIKCIEFQHVIVLITSNSFGSRIVPLLTDLTHVVIYVLQNHWHHFEWGLNFINNLQMFDHDLTLLIRLTRDLAFTYVKKAELCHINQKDQSSLYDALQYLRWARLFYERADYLDCARFSSTQINSIDKQIFLFERTIDTYEENWASDLEPFQISQEAC